MDREARRRQILCEIAAAQERLRPLREELEQLSVPVGAEVNLATHPNRLPKMVPTLTKATLSNSAGPPRIVFTDSEQIDVAIEYASKTPINGIGFAVYNELGTRISGFNTYMANPPIHSLPLAGICRFSIQPRQLGPGWYSLNLSINEHQMTLIDKVDDCLRFQVVRSDAYDGQIRLQGVSFEIEGE